MTRFVRLRILFTGKVASGVLRNCTGLQGKCPRTGERSWLRHVSSHVKYKESEKFREFSRIGRPNFLTGSLGNEFWEISLYFRFSVVPFPVITSLGRFGLIIHCQRDFFCCRMFSTLFNKHHSPGNLCYRVERRILGNLCQGKTF